MSKRVGIEERLRQLPAPPPGPRGWPWDTAGPKRNAEDEPLPRITLVVPSFQQGSTIEKTLRSALLQDYPELELIVFDGGSTDSTVEILKRYAPHLDFWVSERDRGQSHAINKGLARASGEIFNWLNSDDTLEPGALREVARLWKQNAPMLVSGGCDNIDSAGRLQHRWLARPPRRLRDFFTPDRVVLAQPSTFLRTSAVRAAGGIREDLECVMDWELYVRLLLRATGPWTSGATQYCLAKALQHPAAKTQRLARQFAEEAGRLMDGWISEAPAAERPAIAERRRRMQMEELITEAAARPEAGLAEMARLAMAHPETLAYRFYWGALRRAMVKR